ncbi:MAG TPA: hypothetical protein DIU00_07230 [Phycisphaerales bacterium]|nr:hypothetical protein [Phycisphaerales bacterium]
MSKNKNEVFVLIPGYADWSGPGKQHASGTITLIKGQKNVIVDTGIPGQKKLILKKLKEYGVTPSDINFVVITHGHVDHLGNNNLFTKACFILDTDVLRGDEFTIHDFAYDAFHIGDGIAVIHTPGHTEHDASVIVETNDGTVAITGDIFECDGDWKKEAWEPWSKHRETQRKSRERILRIADYIIPGHGDMFEAPTFAELELGPTQPGYKTAVKFLKSSRITSRITDMANHFQTHRSRIDGDSIHNWLLQFGGYQDAQCIFPLLEKIDYIDDQSIVDIFQEYYECFAKTTDKKIVFSLLGGLKDSSSQINYICSKAFKEWERKHIAFESLVSLANAYDPNEITVIFLDDMVGTGNQAIQIFHEWLGLTKKKGKYVQQLTPQVQSWLRQTSLIYFTVVGFQEGMSKIQDDLTKEGLKISVVAGKEMWEEEGCFDAKSLIFENPQVRLHAKKLTSEIGYELFSDERGWSDDKRRRMAMGYGKGQKLIVFSYNTPNCTLPILWKKGKYNGREWHPLFPRRE